MIKQNIDIIKQYISGDRAFATVKEIINYHRVQASPGYREAALYCHEYMADNGIEARILEFEASDHAKYWQQRMFKEWSIKGASLSLIYPERHELADFGENCMSVIQRSLPADFREKPLDIVCLDKGSDPAAYEEIDLKGKIIFIDGDYSKYVDWAVYDKGAVGIITDAMPVMSIIRDRHDLPDATNNVSFKWNAMEKLPLLFGFVLTPRLGDMLRKICAKVSQDFTLGKSDKKYPQAVGYVDAEFYDGHIEDVEAMIKGETDEEIIISAHLCHPRSCANDNASGASAAMEAIRTLNRLISEGRLKRPKRTLRAVLIPEFTGVYAYLSSREAELGKIMAAINLDMVGGKQSEIFGPLIVMSQPDACPSFVKDTALYILDEIKREMQMLALGDFVSTFTSSSVRFSTGSDHSIFADPTVGVPCLALTQWPDKTYHTSQDTLDKIDPKMLERSALLTAAYAYTLADLSVDDCRIIMNRGKQSYAESVAEIYGRFVTKEADGEKTAAMAAYRLELFSKSCQDYLRFFAGEEADAVAKLISEEISWAEEFTESFRKIAGWPDKTNNTAISLKKYSAIPKRLFKGPLIATGYEHWLSDEAKSAYDSLKSEYPDCGSLDSSIVYWCDGKRSIWEINDKIDCERDLNNVEYVEKYINVLRMAGLVEVTAGH